MPRDGSGNYTLPFPDFVPGTVIDQAQIDAQFADIAAALTGSVPRNGEAGPTQDLPMSGAKHTDVADGTAPNHYASVKQIQNGGITWAGITTGTGTAYAVTMPLSYAGPYASGFRLAFRVHATNAAAPTLNVSGLGAKGIRFFQRGTPVDLPAGLLTAGALVEVCYDAGYDKFVLLTPISYAPGEIELAQSVSASAQAAVTLPLPPGFVSFQLRISDTAPSASALPYLRWSYDGGITYAQNGTDYGSAYLTVAAGVVTGNAITTGYAALGDAATASLSGTVDFAIGSPMRGTFALTTYKAGPSLAYTAGGFNGLNAAATHVQFGFVGTTVAAHRIKLVGGITA